MSKTTDAIEELNDAQQKAIKNLCDSKLETVERRRGWFYTGAKCRKDTSRVLCVSGLVEMDNVGGHAVVKPTSLGRRVGKALMACLVMLLMSSCGDNILAAKTTLAIVSIGIQTADAAFKTYAATERTRCLKKGVEGSPEFTVCYKKAADIMEKWALLNPRFEKAKENAASYVAAAESGKGGDYAKAVKETVCLLTEVAAIIPGDWKKKLEAYIALAGAYACDKPAAYQTTPAQDLKMLRIAHRLMSDMLGTRGV